MAIQSVTHAHELGLYTVYQDLAQAPDLTVAENFFLGRELYRPGLLGRLGVLARGRMENETRSALDSLGIRVKAIAAPVRELSGGQRQALAVARANAWATTGLIMDEPTAALGTRQTAIVYDTMRAAAARGLAVLGQPRHPACRGGSAPRVGHAPRRRRRGSARLGDERHRPSA